MDALEVAIARNECSPQAMYQNMMEVCDQDEKEIAGLKAENERLNDFVSLFASCPCCCEFKVCKDDCEFKEGGYEHMELARAALSKANG